MVEVAGADGTAGYEDVGHSEDAREIMAPYLQGVLDDANRVPQARAVKIIQKEPVTVVEKPSSAVTKRGLTAALLIGGAGLVGVLHNGLSDIQVRLFFPPMPKSFKSLSHGGENGFFKGFLLASVFSGAVSSIIAFRVAKAATITSGFLRYPPHIRFAAPPVRHTTGFLVPNVYKPLPLAKKEILGEGLIRLTFDLPTTSTVLGLPTGQHVAIKAQVGEQMITRSYTPTSNNFDVGKLVLLMRIYSDGLLTGGFIDKLKIGDDVQFRGPKGAMKYQRGWAKKLGMIAGGTGITPMYQLIRAICEDERDLTEISLVYANRSEEDILLRKEMERFAKNYPKNLKIWYMLDKYSDDWKFGKGYITRDVLEERMPAPSDDSSTKVLLCGPPPMVNGSKKNLIDLGWKAPGAVSKMADDIFCF